MHDFQFQWLKSLETALYATTAVILHAFWNNIDDKKRKDIPCFEN